MNFKIDNDELIQRIVNSRGSNPDVVNILTHGSIPWNHSVYFFKKYRGAQ